MEDLINILKNFKNNNFTFDIRICGSTNRGTDIETSDIDINIILNTNITNKLLFLENIELLKHTKKEYLIPDEKKEYFNFKSFSEKYFNFRNELLQYLINFKNLDIKNEKKVIGVIYDNQEYDIAVCFDYNFYTENEIYVGQCLIDVVNKKLHLNFLDIMAYKIKNKNKDTNGIFIDIVKIFKVIKRDNKMNISSFSLENLIYQVPNNYFNNKKLENIKNISEYLIEIINKRYQYLLTTEGVMYLNYFLDKYEIMELLKYIIQLCKEQKNECKL